MSSHTPRWITKTSPAIRRPGPHDMDAAATLRVVDAALGALATIMNAVGASQQVSDIIAKRVAEGGRDWTDDERQAILDALDANKKYAADQLGIGDPPVV